MFDDDDKVIVRIEAPGMHRDDFNVELNDDVLTVWGDKQFNREASQGRVLRRCMSDGLVRGEGFAIDASGIKGDANRPRAVPGSETADWRNGVGTTRAMREYLDELEEIKAEQDDDTDL